MPRRNLDPNPSAAVDLTGITGGTSGAAVTPTRVTGLSTTLWSRATAARVTTPTTPGSYTYLWGATHNPGTVLDGLVFSCVAEWMVSAVPTSFALYQLFLDSGGAFIGQPVTTVAGVVANTVSRSVVVATAPTGTRRVSTFLRADGVSSGFQLTRGLTRIEQVNDPNLIPADGASSQWAWDGTAGSSTSTRTVDDGHEWWALLAA